ncbi:MAG: heparinase II/III-family protein, partial [Blastocatellia bacterium]
LLGPAGLECFDALQSVEPPATSNLFEEGGYSIMRDGWSENSSYVLMDCGPHGSLAYGHAHADALSIEFAALGKTWIVDPGTFTYTADPELRDWFRSTQAHNTVTVDRTSQSVSDGPFSWKHVAESCLDTSIFGDGFDYLAASHDGYRSLADPVKHTRTLIHPRASVNSAEPISLPSYLIVRDEFAASGRHEYAISYHLSPKCSAFAIDNHVTVTEPGGCRLGITVFGQPDVRARVDRSWTSRAYGNREPSLVVVFETSMVGAQELVTFITPACDGQSIHVSRQPVDCAAAFGFEVVSDAERDVVLINDQGGPVSCGPLTSASLFALARFRAESFVSGFFIAGHRFETGDGFAFRSAAPVAHCSLHRTDRGVQRSIDGGEFVDLVVGEAGEAVINGTAFRVSQSNALFANAESGGSLIDNPSEAIN